MTWFRSDKRIQWFDLHPEESPEEIAHVIEGAFLNSTVEGT
jgi:tRNA A37 N6-isopentenylltransferase MiaA